MFQKYNSQLEILKANSHLRQIKDIENKDEKFIRFNGKQLLNLSSNNYLGFADNKKITEEFLNNINFDYSFSSASARLLTGTLPVYKDLENLLCDMFKKQSALLFNSGYHANVGIISSLAGKKDVIFSDKLNHASIIDGMKLSDAKFFRYPHNDMTALEKLLNRERNNFENAIIVSESVFSMDGDIADIKKLVELKEKFKCILILDEAHAFGVFGKKGLGIAETLSLTEKVDMIAGTFGKAIGSIGAFAVANKTLIDYLINKARPFIFSTALPPINIKFTKWILENKLPYTFKKRIKMLNTAKKAGSQSQIIPVIIGDNEKTVKICNILYENGYFTLPVRPPTVPEGTSRLRISITAEIDEKELLNAVSLAKQTK